MSSVRMTLICRQVLQQILDRGVQYDKIHKLTNSKRIQFDVSDVKALIAALHFIFSNAAKFDVSVSVLPAELQQLGIPKDISLAICKEFAASKDELRKHLLAKTLTIPAVDSIRWRLDWIMASDMVQTVDAPCVSMQFGLNKSLGGLKQVGFDMTAEQFAVFHNELKHAKQAMDSLQQ